QLPLATRAICKAAHSNRPISSKMIDIKIMATKANVAFQTISVTVITSEISTTPTSKAISAQPTAEKPIFNSFGCQITKINVRIKIHNASNDVSKDNPPEKYTLSP